MSEHVLPAEEPIRFVAPIIQDNPTGWGPCEMPEQFRDMPYQPFSKGDRLGKISDWTMVQDKKYQNKYASQFGAGSLYAYVHDEDENSFHLVDTKRDQKPPYQRGRARGQRGRGARGARTPGGMTTLSKQQRDRKLGKRWGQRGAPMKIRDASVTVRPTWVTIEDMDFPRLAKLSLPGIKEGEDIVCCGTLEYYDKAYDRVNVKHEKPLQRIDRIFHTVTTTDDPVIRRLSKTTGTVYRWLRYDRCIMCCTRSNYSWDIVIEKIGDKLFLDKRDNTEFDLLTVNETSVEPPADDGNSINSPRNLALEATFINHNFIRDNSRHVILGTQQFKPHEFAAQINLSMDNAWGILRCIIDICMKQKDGKYLIMKDPNKPLIRLYDIPDNTFESDASEESGDEPADTPFAPLYSYGNSKRI
ncbi:eukaryotic translation initiation factor 3 subunit D [Danaus plexippus plexippus]|uniref:Eukaryotic translation initiation factor 3 subunit p66 n=1 Tax=Danaus plexippus plexippus TaxID=278856 RepID=A0A212F506_DANPL|nr:eukaryotic translation initiation factor 3 subunit D [Danaus plexippus plexippus]